MTASIYTTSMDVTCRNTDTTSLTNGVRSRKGRGGDAMDSSSHRPSQQSARNPHSPTRRNAGTITRNVVQQSLEILKNRSKPTLAHKNKNNNSNSNLSRSLHSSNRRHPLYGAPTSTTPCTKKGSVSLRNRRFFSNEAEDISAESDTLTTEDSSVTSPTPPVPAWKKRLAMRQGVMVVPPPVPTTLTTPRRCKKITMEIGKTSNHSQRNNTTPFIETHASLPLMDAFDQINTSTTDNSASWQVPHSQFNGKPSQSPRKISAKIGSERFQRPAPVVVRMDDDENDEVYKNTNTANIQQLPTNTVPLPTQRGTRKALKGTAQELGAVTLRDRSKTTGGQQQLPQLAPGSAHTARSQSRERRSASKERISSRSASKERTSTRSASKERTPSRSASKERNSNRSASKERTITRSASKERTITRSASKERPNRSIGKPPTSTRSLSKERPRRRSPTEERISIAIASTVQTTSSSSRERLPTRSSSLERPTRTTASLRTSTPRSPIKERSSTIPDVNMQEPSLPTTGISEKQATHRGASKSKPQTCTRNASKSRSTTRSSSTERPSRSASKKRTTPRSPKKTRETARDAPRNSKQTVETESDQDRKDMTVVEDGLPSWSQTTTHKEPVVSRGTSRLQDSCHSVASAPVVRARDGSLATIRQLTSSNHRTTGSGDLVLQGSHHTVASAPVSAAPTDSSVVPTRLSPRKYDTLPAAASSKPSSPTSRMYISPGMRRKSAEARDRMARESAVRRSCILESLGAVDDVENDMWSLPVSVKGSKYGRSRAVVELESVPPAFRHLVKSS